MGCMMDFSRPIQQDILIFKNICVILQKLFEHFAECSGAMEMIDNAFAQKA